MNDKIKNIAILTQAPVGTNYGSTIQAWALQKILKEKGFNPTTIDRVRENKNHPLKIVLSEFKDNFKNRFTNELIITEKVFNKIFEEQFQFVKENIRISKRIHTDKELKDHFNTFDYEAVIVGSDQTWRPDYSPNIYNYFLDFLEDNDNILKLAYATSYGTSEWEFSENETKKCTRLIQQFYAISVREESGVELTKKHLKKDAVWVLDPTMLLNKEEYLAIANTRKTPKRNGVYSYILDETPGIVNVIKQTKEILDLDSFINQPKCRTNVKTSKRLEDYKYPSVEGWIKSFEDADFVVTNSFHGTAFCVIFNKPFLTIVNKERGASRFYSLLGKLGLESRILDSTDVNKSQLKEIILKSIDFSNANQKLEEMKKESLAFLFNALDRK